MENATHNHDTRPIGFWLRSVDRLLTREFAAAFANEEVTRREWMILSVLDGTVDVPHLAARVQRGGKRVRALAERGWVAEAGDGTWTLTEEGRAAKARLTETVDGIRSKVAAAVSPEDYATTLASLEAMARALGGDSADRMPFGPGRGHRRFGGPRHERRFGHHGHGRGHGHGFDPEHRFGPGFGPGAGHPGHPGHDERAYERGFDAGFARGQQARPA